MIEPFVLLLSPFAPHVAEELWEVLGHEPSVSQQPWPIFDPAMTVSERMTIPIQVNGRLEPSSMSLPMPLAMRSNGFGRQKRRNGCKGKSRRR